MQSLNKLDTMIYRLHGKAKPTPGDVGIELELEGSLKLPEDPLWAYKEEGSLRGGGEYVLKKPVSLATLSAPLLSLEKTLASSKPEVSIRCSTHIHVNITDLSARQIWQFLCVYYLLEPLLMRTQPKKRWANLFCLTMEFAEGVYLALRNDLLESEVPFRGFNKENHRYAALNLVAIQKFGSVEFRFLDAITDMRLLELWCRSLHQLVVRGASTPPLHLLKMYDELTPQEFIQHFFGEGAGMIFDKVSRNSADLNTLIHTNYDYVFELAHDLSNQKFEMPPSYWEDDIDVGLRPWHDAPPPEDWLAGFGAAPIPDPGPWVIVDEHPPTNAAPEQNEF